MFHDRGLYSFLSAFEAEWSAIRDEYLGVRDRLIDWPEKKLYGDAGWQVFGLYDFPHGRPMEENIRRCPVTARLVADLVPTHGATGFSVLRPGVEIKPHQGYAGDFLRCHVGLICPQGDCALEVAGETRRWSEGVAWVFDDRAWHQAWNRTDSDRVVLLFDFVPPVA